jgi:hypothetical protein
VPRTKRSGSKSNRRHHRQPKREKSGKGGAWIDPPGYDSGKKIKGKKRHILVDTLGLLLHAIVHGADIQDRDGGIMLLSTTFGMHPFLKKLLADAAYQWPGFHNDLARVLPHLETARASRSCALLQSASCSESYAIQYDLSGQTLTN